jgi:hypothetical protein
MRFVVAVAGLAAVIFPAPLAPEGSWLGDLAQVLARILRTRGSGPVVGG